MKMLIKIGGSVLEEAENIRRIAEDCQCALEAGIPLTIVHGGGKAITRALAAQKISSAFIDGLRITTAAMMDVIEMVLSGQINKKLVRIFNSMGIPAWGLSGADAQLLLCSQLNSYLGRVGRIEKINIPFLEQLMALRQQGKITIPIIAPIGVDHKGEALNINADWAASSLAVELGLKTLIFLTDTQGIYCEGLPMPQLNRSDLRRLIEKSQISGGMLAKVNATLHALNNGVEQVHIVNGHQTQAITHALNFSAAIGTVCLP